MTRRDRTLFGVEARTPRIAGVSIARGLLWVAVFAIQRAVMRQLESWGRRVG